MAALIDLVGSSIVGGWVLVSLLSFFSNVESVSMHETLVTSTDEELSNATAIVESDIRKAGYNIADPVKMLRADSNAVAFKLDIDRDGVLDSVSYYLALPAGGSAGTPMDLVRKLNGGSGAKVLGGITNFLLRYQDSTGAATAVLQNVRWITVSMTAQSSMSADGENPAIYWQKTFNPMNLR